MIKRFLSWLKTIYLKPAQAETQTPGVTMSEPLVDATVEQPSVAVVDNVAPVAVQAAADEGRAGYSVAEAKAGVADLDAALNFIESGVAQLGDAAKDELKALAKKYL